MVHSNIAIVYGNIPIVYSNIAIVYGDIAMVYSLSLLMKKTKTIMYFYLILA